MIRHTLSVAQAQAGATATSWTLALRVMLSPALIGAASIASRLWGPSAGGWFAALPLTSGPVALVLAYERGARYASDACAGIILAIVALAAYVLAYAWTSRRRGPGVSALAGCCAYMLCVFPLGKVAVGLVGAFLIAAGVIVVSGRLLPNETRARGLVAQLPTWDIPLRMCLAAALVWGLAQLSLVVGPRISGLLTPFPVAVTIMSTFTHRHEGGRAARMFLRSMLTGLLSFAEFFAVAGALLRVVGILPAFLVAVTAALVTHAVAWRLMDRRGRMAPVSPTGTSQ